MSGKSLVVDVPVNDEHGDSGGEIFVKLSKVVCGTPKIGFSIIYIIQFKHSSQNRE